MTRDFNKQPRNDSRPPFRNSSSKHNNRDERTERTERTPRTSRPRLNREVVDRAWESGAPQRHADYRPRETNRQGGQYSRSPRNTQGGRYEQYGNAPRNSQRGQYGNSPRSSHDYNNNNTSRVNNYSDSNYGPRRDRDDRGFQDRRPGNGQYQGSRDTYSPRNNNTRGNQRDGYRDNHYNSSSRFPQQDRHTGGRNSYGNEGQRFNRRDDYRENDGHTRSNGHFEQRGYSQRPYQGRNQGRDERFHEGRGNDRYNQYDQRPPRQRSFEGPQAQFEGDYESFNEQRDSHERPSRPPRSEERPFRGSPNNRGQSETRHQRDERPRERHVTPLPDGRVIKGSRPAQRRNARFWTDVSEETDELLNHVSPVAQNDAEPATASQELSETPEGTDIPEHTAGVLSNEPETGSDEHSAKGAENAHTSSEADNNAEFAATREAIRRRTRAASAVVREKKEKHSKSTGPRPSQPGFKWPTQ